MLLPAAAAAMSFALIGTSVPFAAAVVSGAHNATSTSRTTAQKKKSKKKKVTKLKVTKRKQRLMHARIAVTSAPMLTLSGTTLSWTPMTGVSTYEVATITGTTTTYQTMTGTSFTPPAAPGQTVNYGVRSYVSGSEWSSRVSITWPNTLAPTLTLSGTTLSWTPMTGVSTYEVATITGTTTTYQTMTGTSFTPPAAPSQTVNYGVRSYVSGSEWSSRVSITWPNTLAPTLTLSGTTLSWTPMTGVSTYEVATITGTTTTDQTVTGTSFTPPAAPGQTVNYGVRSDVAGSQGSSQVSITWPNTLAPTLTLSGTTLSWTPMTGVSTYEVATITGTTTTYQTMTGTSFTPPAAPGQTVNYGVRSDVAGSQGSSQVSITWPNTLAPTLTLSGTTLSWTPMTGVSTYEVATITGTTTTYQTMTGTSFTPPAVPGQTVNYGVRSSVSGSEWSSQVSITWPNTLAPTLTLSGTTLSWTPITGVSTYEVATITGTTTTYQTVTGTSFTPPAVPGQTVNYGVRSYVSGSEWSSQVSITWTPAPVQTAGKLKVGVMDIGNYNYSPFNSAQVFSNAGVTYTREDVGGGANTGTCDSTDYVCTALQNGVAPIVLFEGYADSNMTSEIVSLAQHLNTLAQTYPVMNNMHVIEFANEVYAGTSGPQETATTYGQQYNAAHAALAAAGLGSWKLLAIGANYCSYGAVGWIPQVIAAQSTGAAGIDGWTVHPYGLMNDDTGTCPPGEGFGWPEVNDYHTIAVNAGSNAPWYVTEVGQCLGGSGCDAVSEATQAADMQQYLTDAGGDVRTGTAAKYPWIAAFIWYQAYDDTTGFFGLLSNGSNFGEPVDYQRPAFTTLEQWIAANGEG